MEIFLELLLGCLAVLALALFIFVVASYYWAFRDNEPWLFDEESYTPAAPRTVPPAPAVVIVRRDFGTHTNPLKGQPCSEQFTQINARTWQCPSCGLIRFQREEE